MRRGDWKLVVVMGEPRLYNLANDIHEDNDLAAVHPEIVRELVDIIKKEHRDNPMFEVTMPKF